MWMQTGGATAIVLVLSGTPTLGGDNLPVGAGGVDWSRFETAYRARGLIGEWDSDRNGAIGEAEYERGLAASYDADRNGRLDPGEAARAPRHPGAFAGHDGDGDGALSADEIGPGLAAGSGILDTNADGILGVHELIAARRR